MGIIADKKDGKLTGRYRVELQAGFKRLRKRFDTLAEAEAAEAHWRRMLAKGEVPEFAKERSVNVGPQSLDDLARAVNGELWVGDSSERLAHQRLGASLRILGPSRLIESITISDTDRLVRGLRLQGKAAGTINRHLSAFTTAMKWAVERGYRKAPLPKLSWQDEDEGRIRWLTPTEEKVLYAHLPHAIKLMVQIGIKTGMRCREILNLTPANVDGSWVHLWGAKDKRGRGGTKNGKGRSIPLDGDTLKAVTEFLALDPKPTYETMRYHWDKTKALMGLTEDEDFVFHCTRHTFATRAVQAGVHPRVLQQLMGHKHITTTMRYMQVGDQMLVEAIGRMSEEKTHAGLVA